MQLLADYSFSSTVTGAVSQHPMAAIRYVGAHVWQSFVRRGADGIGHMQRGIEPMVSSNAHAGDMSTRPEHRPSHMMYASAYVQNRKEIVRWTLAVEAGISRRVA